VDFTQFTKWTVRLLYMQIGICAVGIVSGMMEHSVLTALNDGSFASSEKAVAAADANDVRQAVVGIIQLAIYLVSGIWILRWIYLANRNVRELGARGMEFSPGWSVGWFFVPIMNLWKPYQAMREIWQASERPHDWQTGPAHGLLVGWWTLWLISSAVGRASFRMSLRAEEIEELLAANRVMLLSDFIDIPSSIVFLMVVKTIHEMQTAPRTPVVAAEALA
jgi:hypothetical protein